MLKEWKSELAVNCSASNNFVRLVDSIKMIPKRQFLPYENVTGLGVIFGAGIRKLGSSAGPGVATGDRAPEEEDRGCSKC